MNNNRFEIKADDDDWDRKNPLGCIIIAAILTLGGVYIFLWLGGAR